VSASVGSPSVTTDELAELTEALRLARRELKLARGRQEAAEETLQQVRRQRAALRDQVRVSSDALAQLLSERYWEGQRAGGLVGLLRPGRDDVNAEREQVAAVEASDLFDAGWYLRQRPDAVRELLSPAAHYVRIGARDGAEPGPRFDTKQYLRDHPEARDSDLAPLLHHLRHAGD
jgi:hypothetical protein